MLKEGSEISNAITETTFLVLRCGAKKLPFLWKLLVVCPCQSVKSFVISIWCKRIGSAFSYAPVFLLCHNSVFTICCHHQKYLSVYRRLKLDYISVKRARLGKLRHNNITVLRTTHAKATLKFSLP